MGIVRICPPLPAISRGKSDRPELRAWTAAPRNFRVGAYSTAIAPVRSEGALGRSTQGKAMRQHLRIRALSQEFENRDMNEADTRSKVIDPVIHEVLDWPTAAVTRELFVNPGYADYLLHNAAGNIALVIEAKREGIYFELPARSGIARTTPDFVSVRSLLTVEAIKTAINQVRTYASDIGANFACITNGHQWIVFRVFEPGTDWRSLRAFVIPSLAAIDSAFTTTYNSLSYRCVSFDGSLNSLLSRSPLENRETYRAGHEIPAYTRTIQSNRYVQYLRPIAEKFFGVIEIDQVEFMNACYVSDANYESAFKSAEALLTDSLTPYLIEYGIRDTRNDDGGGTFGNRLEKSLTAQRGTDVVVLFGGKGIGKSTFLRRLLFVRPPQILRRAAVTVLVDLLNIPEEKRGVELFIWTELIRQMDINNTLDGTRDELLILFQDRFEQAKRQSLFGIPPESLDYNKTLNALVSKWKDDQRYVALKLIESLRRQHRGLVVVIDNTDQYSALQEYCFTVARQIATDLKSLVIVSMREEKFYASSIHGVLDAFQNSGFHLSSPSPRTVFLKRLGFVHDLLTNDRSCDELLGVDTPGHVRTTLARLLLNFQTEFNTPNSHLSNFLTACAHGNIRLALELFRGMLQSRYTNIDEITSRNDWTWQIHQVLKPVMIPNRFFYEEGQSHVPNVFQLRNKRRASHFTTLRILSPLAKLTEIQGAAFYSLPQLFTELSNRFHMEEDQRASVDLLLRYGLIESNNRQDEYSESIDSIRISAYGKHIFDNLSSAFTYLDLIATDTALFDSRVSAELAALAILEYDLWENSFQDASKRVERVEARVKKASEFLDYLGREEDREAELYSLAPEERFVPRIRFSLDDEIEGVRKSANRQRYRS